ncbi:hypothetical protein LTR10_018533 [Elasticomyces elasticus]|uniref:Glutamine synthetase n=1 Tax=Exophiala sideris TaxID=1016849 RepID=A0ABR0JNE8_9EURO|nr:hypothetical protein LTR10_018533 [Elasticomyces elasticus]KAK5038015.1 hypothetical protein LTS07_001482 [Exophiala sideris]KAK5043997.1 hypothetical protein LTR13_000352 [Exophiala sideris]KAK5067496.1 hypothetical protein LTR69_001484 [Exophiala sideris]
MSRLLAHDHKVKVAGVDGDGILRGKIMDKDKFLSSLDDGFGFSSVLYGWDIQDVLFAVDAKATSVQEGYGDFNAIPDTSSFRRIPWEDNIPLFLLRFEINKAPVPADGRSIIRSLCEKIGLQGYKSMAGVEMEFMNFQTPSEDGYDDLGSRRNIAAYLLKNAPNSLRNLTSGVFSYSLTRPMANKDYFHQIFDRSVEFRTNIEGWHTEYGPGVFEAALKVSEIDEMADRVTLFKLLVKSLGVEYNITPCFMAKPVYGLAGNSGHIHISLVDREGKNAFARKTPDPDARWKDIAEVSDIGRYFLAGLLTAIPDLMPLFAPTINSYKRLVENYWAPTSLGWGLEDRNTSIRLIAPPVSKPGATRFEVRIPGADLHPHYALSALLGAGWRGVEKKLDIPFPPAALRKEKSPPLPNSLDTAVARFKAPESIAREIFPDAFVDLYAASREHEVRLYKEAVTDWYDFPAYPQKAHGEACRNLANSNDYCREFKRYIETV